MRVATTRAPTPEAAWSSERPPRLRGLSGRLAHHAQPLCHRPGGTLMLGCATASMLEPRRASSSPSAPISWLSFGECTAHESVRARVPIFLCVLSSAHELPYVFSQWFHFTRIMRVHATAPCGRYIRSSRSREVGRHGATQVSTREGREERATLHSSQARAKGDCSVPELQPCMASHARELECVSGAPKSCGQTRRPPPSSPGCGVPRRSGGS
mmetsp:Transcript_40163/g.133948  ORF Transcript_40163/g.133948 Transcript_40163/m.133948 type:complete len:213 (+) Transcript_40163:1683-2321(+)